MRFKTKKLLGLFVGILLMTLACSVITFADDPVLNETKVQVVQKATVKLRLKNATDGKIKWKSSNRNVARVTSKGNVTARKPGKCKITASYNGKTYKCIVKVVKVQLSAKKLTMVPYRTEKLSLNNKKLKVVWTSSNSAVASVDSKGYVSANRTGTCVITAQAGDIILNCEVTVVPISVDTLRAAYSYKKSKTDTRKTIVLAGSSSVDYWRDAPKVFSSYRVVNTAVAGTVVTQWQEWYRKLITFYKPDAIVLYVGSNDLGGWKISGEENAANTIKLLSSIRGRLKKVPIFYVSVNPCWVFQHAFEQTAISNRLVKQFCDKQKNMYYIDIASAFAALDGTPNRALFVDQLHPNGQGYSIWRNMIGTKVKQVLKKSNKQKG